MVKSKDGAALVMEPETIVEPDAPAAIVLGKAPKAPAWQASSELFLGIRAGQPAKLIVTFVLDGAAAAPLTQKGAERLGRAAAGVEADLRASPEYADWQTTAKRLELLAQARSQVQKVLEKIEADLAGPIDPSEIAGLAKRKSEARDNLDSLQQNEAHSRNDLAIKANAVAKVAVGIATQVHSSLKAEVDEGERTAEGLLEVATEALGRLVSLGSITGSIRDPFWGRNVAKKTAEGLIGKIPPMPAPPAAPPAPPQPCFGMNAPPPPGWSPTGRQWTLTRVGGD